MPMNPLKEDLKRTLKILEYKVRLNISILEIIFIVGSRNMTQLHWVRIYFDTPTFDKITKDQKANFETKLSAIGGTMGLLTGFSLISGVEILYFVVKKLLNITGKKPKTKTK